jgi:hypothetical protein
VSGPGQALQDDPLPDPAGRVEDWRSTLKGLFPAPASSNAACGFPALRFPVNFT